MRSIDPLGYRLDGTPFWGFFGRGDDDGDAGAGTDSGGTTDSDDDTDDDSGGGDTEDSKLKRALDAERTTVRDLKRAVAPWRKLEREFQMSPDQIREKLTSNDTDADRVRREAETAAQQKVNARLVRAEVKALAVATFADVDDALRNIDLEAIEVDDEGEVDTTAIDRELKAILQRKPHLAKKAEEGGEDKDATDFDGGARRTPPKQVSMSDFVRRQAGIKAGSRR